MAKKERLCGRLCARKLAVGVKRGNHERSDQNYCGPRICNNLVRHDLDRQSAF